MTRTLELSLSVDGEPIGNRRTVQKGEFSLSVPLEGISPGKHQLKITANTFVVPYDYAGADDFRPLSFRLLHITLS